MTTTRFGNNRVKVVQSTTRTDRVFHISIQYGDTNAFTSTTAKIVIGGVPLSMSYLTNGLLITDPLNVSAGSNVRVYALRVIEKASTTDPDPSNPSEIQGMFESIRVGFSKDLDFKNYLNIDKVAGTAVPTTEMIFRGTPLVLGDNNELIVIASGYTVDDIEEYSVSYIGGIPTSIGRIGNDWFLIVVPI